MATLSINNRFFAFEDEGATNSPLQRNFDWSRQISGLPVENPSCLPFRIPPFAQVEVFNGTRSLAVDGTTQFSLSPVNLAPNRYRLKWTGTGTAPGFRTDRAINFSPPSTITVTPQLNESVAITASAGSVFGSVVPGDVVFIPGISTGESASVFDPLNEGVWSVLAATASSLILGRNPGTVFSSKAEIVTIAANASFQVFSSNGVQLDDTLSLVSGFSPVLLQAYEIVAVTANSVDFVSGTTLPPVAAIIPGLNSIVVYENAKTWIALETDQIVQIAINSSVASFTVEPVLAGDPSKKGVFQLMGTVYSLSITNKSTLPASVKVLSAE